MEPSGEKQIMWEFRVGGATMEPAPIGPPSLPAEAAVVGTPGEAIEESVVSEENFAATLSSHALKIGQDLNPLSMKDAHLSIITHARDDDFYSSDVAAFNVSPFSILGALGTCLALAIELNPADQTLAFMRTIFDTGLTTGRKPDVKS